MRVILSRSDLLSLVQKAQSIIPAKPQTPILSNVLLKASGNQLTLSASDLTLSIQVRTHANVIEEGSVVLSPKKLAPLIRELNSPDVEISVNSSFTASILSGSSQFKIPGMSAEEYPIIADLSGGMHVPFPTTILKEMLSKTSFSAGKDETRPIFSSVLIQRTETMTTFTGTDGKRLAKTHTDTPLASEWQGSFVLPIKTVEEMIRILDTKEETIDLYFLGEKISLQVGSISLTSQLLSGQYPDVSKIIPEKQENSIKVHREELMTLLRQVALFTTTERASVRFNFNQGALTLSIANGETGEGQVSMPVNYDKDPLDIAFNPHYLLEILRHSQDEVIDLDVKDGYNPGLITDTSRALFVLMPMRLEM